MKTIKLTESQLNVLLEANGAGAPNFNGGDLKEYPDSEIRTTANITNPNGDEEYGEEPDTDEIGGTMTSQCYGTNGTDTARYRY